MYHNFPSGLQSEIMPNTNTCVEMDVWNVKCGALPLAGSDTSTSHSLSVNEIINHINDLASTYANSTATDYINTASNRRSLYTKGYVIDNPLSSSNPVTQESSLHTHDIEYQGAVEQNTKKALFFAWVFGACALSSVIASRTF